MLSYEIDTGRLHTPLQIHFLGFEADNCYKHWTEIALFASFGELNKEICRINPDKVMEFNPPALSITIANS